MKNAKSRTNQISNKSSAWIIKRCREILNPFSSKAKLTTVMYVLALLLLLLVLTRSMSSCSHSHLLPASSSRWLERLASHQHPNPPTSHGNHLARLRINLRELAMMIENKKERFARDEMDKTFSYLVQAHSHISYDAVLPRGALAPQQDRVGELKLAYDTFQRLAILVEVVKADISHHRDASRATQHLWQLVERGLMSVLEQVCMELRATVGEHLPLPLTREVVPDWLRCMAHSVERDTRDFIVLRDTLQAAIFFNRRLEGR